MTQVLRGLTHKLEKEMEWSTILVNLICPYQRTLYSKLEIINMRSGRSSYLVSWTLRV